MNNSNDSCSLAVIGDGSVGKSSIISAFRTEGFIKVYKQTIGIDFHEKTLKIRGDIYVSLRVWDIGGQSINSKSLGQYLGPANAIFMMYDVTNPESFFNLEDWLINVRKYSKASHIYIVGNKIDMIDIRQVKVEQHDRFIEENNLHGGLFMSAKTGENVVKTFYQVAAELVGIKLSSYELAFHDRVLTAHVTLGNKDDSKVTAGGDDRTAWADQIEAEDAALEAKKLADSASCQCNIS
jgi:small GTP-binding protein